jgi:hypothetical protein
VKRQSPLYQCCDVAIEQYPDKRITVLANENGRASIQELIPYIPIDWRRLTGSELSSDWRTIAIVPSGPWATYDARRLSFEITRVGARVLIKHGEDYEIT